MIVYEANWVEVWCLFDLLNGYYLTVGQAFYRYSEMGKNIIACSYPSHLNFEVLRIGVENMSLPRHLKVKSCLCMSFRLTVISNFDCKSTGIPTQRHLHAGRHYPMVGYFFISLLFCLHFSWIVF